ncbi:hypothetical protein AXI59_00095 [Bacillus nakamurai]|uniref:Carbohydrate kinase PfkB domain-containing protein n=1 Tax=Bacillus nakamurai TaxID=1793963 RepID=A0A150F5L0_9BACI|nr:hypothetical protein AXI58_18230 [Bacillus nakamurai]KXZ24130.1 hypothetical protein AXI59_00095 [Bacillus nakamurai]
MLPEKTGSYRMEPDLNQTPAVKTAVKRRKWYIGETSVWLFLFIYLIAVADIIDTLGAGDSFIAGFLTGFFEHQDIRHALEEAARTAAKTCGVFGAFGYGHPYRPDGGKSSEKTRIL